MLAMFKGEPISGPPGVTFTPFVSQSGEISWTNDGSLQNPESVNIKGPQGEQGPIGLPGTKVIIHETYGPSPEVIIDMAVPDTPIHPVSEIKFVQEGEGSPTPDNVRNIIGWGNATLTWNSENIIQTFPETVYGGSYDWTTGVLTVKHRYFNLRVADMNNDETHPGWNDVDGLLDCIPKNTISLLDVDWSSNITTLLSCNTNYNNRILFIPTDAVPLSQSEWKEKYPSLIAQIILPLLEQKTIQLTSKDFTTLTSENVFFSNCGNTSVTFQAELKKYVDKQICDTASNPPKLSEHGTWMVWDSEQGNYIDTGLSATGPQGPAGSTADIYSTEEINIGTWINGKPLYRKVFASTTPTNVNSGESITEALNDINFVSKLDGILKNGNSIVQLPTIAGTSIYYQMSSKTIIATSGNEEQAGKPIYVTIEYTKATD